MYSNTLCGSFVKVNVRLTLPHCVVCSAVQCSAVQCNVVQCGAVCRAFMGGAEPRVKCLTLPVWGRGKEGRGDELGGREEGVS